MNMKRLILIIFAAFAACTKFDCPTINNAQQRVLNYVSNAYFYRNNAIKWDGTKEQYEKVLRGEVK